MSQRSLSNRIYEKLTNLVHVIGGLLTSFLTVINPTLAVLLFIGFIIYELDEDWHISDEAFQDIREFLIGMFIGAIILLIPCFM